MLRIATDALTFDDVLLLPAYSQILPSEVTLNSRVSRNIALNIPMVSSAMDTVTEARLAIAIAQEGGIGVVHKNMQLEQQAREVRAVKKFESGIIRDPVTITPSASMEELFNLTRDHGISGVPVVDGAKLVGIITSRDVRFEQRTGVSVADIMTPRERLVTAKEGTDFNEIRRLLHEHRIEKVLLVADDGQLTGMVTVKDIAKAEAFPTACKDEQGQLRVAASVGISADTDDRVAALVEAGGGFGVVYYG
ncbi:MAG TPA: IMP dehydrogenase, partial [Gammaproteobacteria bacterium]|nr:IMP dehydrogenase [Gammaproteobacteria bacterium]